MTAFATAADLGKKLKRDFAEGEETEWIEELLEDASGLIRTELEQEVFPRRTSTYTAYPTNGREDLPQWPVVSVDAVTRNGEPIAWTYRPGILTVDGDEPCEVTFTWGYENAPRELQRLTCVLVSQALLPLEAQLGLTVGGLSSAQIDDFRLAWADGGKESGMELTEHNVRRIRRQFSRGSVHVSESSG